MPKPRSAQIVLNETPYYHLVSRCVRRAFLCGVTETFDFGHRRKWISERREFLSKIFAIDTAAFAFMSNHYHLVVRVDAERANNWTQLEVIARWRLLFRIHPLVEQSLSDTEFCPSRLHIVNNIVENWRKRLTDISWFMRCLNEHIARLANLEDQCTGRFWEGRFKSQALLDMRAVFTGMVYVDLNPIRANQADTPETSEHTTIQQRLGKAVHCALHGTLLPFSDQLCAQENRPFLPYTFTDYVELVEWTGRHIRSQHKGAMSKDAPPILARLGINTAAWLRNCQQLETDFHQVIGPLSAVKHFCKSIGQQWLQGQGACQRSFG